MKSLITTIFSVLMPVLMFAQKHKIELKQLDKGVFVHTSYQDIGGKPFPSNGIIIDTEGGIVLIETAWGDGQTKALLKKIKKQFNKKVLFCLATHAHADRIGGVEMLKKNGIPTFTTPLIRQMAIERKEQIPEGTLSNDTTFVVNGTKIRYFFAGEGHTKENTVVYLPDSKVLWGGCLVKSPESVNMGFIGDANMNEWANTIRKVMAEFPDRRVVIPGHQGWGNGEALDFTLKLLELHQKKANGG